MLQFNRSAWEGQRSSPQVVQSSPLLFISPLDTRFPGRSRVTASGRLVALASRSHDKESSFARELECACRCTGIRSEAGSASDLPSSRFIFVAGISIPLDSLVEEWKLV